MKPTTFERGEQWHAWLSQAHAFIAQGGSLSAFVAHAHPSNRPIARRAYKSALAQRLHGAGPSGF